MKCGTKKISDSLTVRTCCRTKRLESNLLGPKMYTNLKCVLSPALQRTVVLTVSLLFQVSHVVQNAPVH